MMILWPDHSANPGLCAEHRKTSGLREDREQFRLQPLLNCDVNRNQTIACKSSFIRKFGCSGIYLNRQYPFTFLTRRRRWPRVLNLARMESYPVQNPGKTCCGVSLSHKKKKGFSVGKGPTLFRGCATRTIHQAFPSALEFCALSPRNLLI